MLGGSHPGPQQAESAITSLRDAGFTSFSLPQDGGSASHHSVPASICSLTPAQTPRTRAQEDSPPWTWSEADLPDSCSLIGLRLSLVFTRHKLSCCSQLDTRARCEELCFIMLESAVPLIQQGFVGSTHDYTGGRKAPPHIQFPPCKVQADFEI